MSPQSGTFVAPNIRLSHQLGEGGMGEVWVADHLTLERRVAVKLIRGLSDGDEARARFDREAKAAARIQNPHVVQVFDYGLTQTGMPYITMELLAGENLAERIARGPVSPQELAPILVQTANALATAHGSGVVHRDIKPPNIFLVSTPSGAPFVKVLDFGIAMLQGDASGLLAGAQGNTPPPGSGPQPLTQTGALLGTPDYMSPEQLLTTGAEVTHSTDIWSLGVVAYEALIGARPFTGQTVVALCMSICESRYDRERIPPRFRGWFDRAFAVAPVDRFASVLEAAEAFRDLALDTTGAAHTVTRSAPPPAGLSRGAMLGLALAACAVGAILVVVAALPKDDKPKKTAAKDDTNKPSKSKKKKKKKKNKKRKKSDAPSETVTPTPAPPEPTAAPEPTEKPSAEPSPPTPPTPPSPVTPRPAATPSKCTTSCRDVGACGLDGDTCVVRSSADCRQSGVCRSLGRCAKVGAACTATSAADCAASSECKNRGDCGWLNGTCRPTSSAHCRQSSRCPDAGKCSLAAPYCVPGSDADCAASRVCRDNKQCFKNNMVCSTKK